MQEIPSTVLILHKCLRPILIAVWAKPLSASTLIDELEICSNFGEAFKLSTELVAAVAVGTIIGFILDNWFGTKPWLILIFFFIGVIAGILNVIRSAKNMQK